MQYIIDDTIPKWRGFAYLNKFMILPFLYNV